MKKLTFLVVLLFGLSQAYSQTELTQTIRGTVIDKEAESPLIGVNVLVLGLETPIGTSTDLDGTFRLENVPVGRQTIQFTYIGYKSVTLSNQLINSAKEFAVNIQMEEDLNNLEEVVVTGKKEKGKAVNEMATVSARAISMEEVTKFAGSTGDIARMAQNYAGVSGSTDDRNDIIVRGNSPSSVLWRMEGVDIPSPNHWATLGSTGGPISMLNSNNLRQSDFLSSAFPSEYGNATGAVFDLKLRNGNPDKFEFLGQIGFNGFEGGIEGPLGFGKKASFLVNYRYSTLGVFQALGIDFGTGSSIPQYQDVNFKINIPTEKAGRFSLWGLGGISDIQFRDEPDGNNLFTNGAQSLRSATNTGIAGLNHLYFLNKNTSSSLSLSWSGSDNLTFIEEVVDIVAGTFEPTFDSNQLQSKVGVNWTINSKINAKNRIKAGLILDTYSINIKDSLLLSDDTWFVVKDYEGSASLYRGFAQWQHKFNDELTLNAGVHSSLFALNNSKTLEPRIGLSYEASTKSTFAIGFGRHSQLQPLPIYFNKNRDATAVQNLANEQLDFIKSDHYVASWNYSINNNNRIKIETYLQRLRGLAVDPTSGDFSLINFGADFGFPNRVGLTNEGTGRNVGIELTLERFLNKGFYYLFTASIFDSQYEGSDKVSRNTFFNSNYVFNALAGKEFVLNDKFAITIDGKISYAGGRRYTPFDIEASIAAEQGIRDESKIFEAQFDPYIRPDIKIGFRQNAKGYSQTFSVDLQNFIGRRNQFGVRYNPETMKESFSFQRGFFPDVRYQILF